MTLILSFLRSLTSTMMKTASLRCAHLMLGLNCLPYIFNKSLLAMQTLKPLKDVIAIEIASQ